MKKVFAVVLACLCMCSSLTVFAADYGESEFISIEEYKSAIKEAGEKYGVDCEVLDYNPDIQLTKEMLEKAINDIRLSAESFEVQQVTLNVEDGNISTRSMPVTKDVYGTFKIKDFYGEATIRVDANVTVNAQNGNVMSVNSTNAYQTGFFINFTSWQTTSISKRLNSPSNGWITLTVSGRATFSYADPWTGITTGYTHNTATPVRIECD